MAEARRVELRALCSEIVDCPHSTPRWTESGVVVLRSKNIRNGRLDLAAEPSFTTEEGYRERIRRAAPSAGDLVITREAPMGEVCMLPTGLRSCLGQRMVLLRPDPRKIDGRYLLFALQSPFMQHQILLHEGTGSTVSNLRIPALEALKVPAPPMEEQRRIAAILGALDDKIELNRRMNCTLEELAQAVFKSWFINFDGEDDLVESGIGLVPRGWRLGGPDDLVELDPSTPLRRGTETVYADMKALPTSGPAVAEWDRRPYAGGSRFRVDDTLLARITPCLENGKSALVDFLEPGEVGFGSTEFIVLRPRAGVPRAWPYCLVRHEAFRAHAITNMNGSSGRQRVPASALRGFAVAVPPTALLDRFGAVTDPLFTRITCNTRQSRTLATLRDTLLPKLISGELRVHEAESTASEAL